MKGGFVCRTSSVWQALGRYLEPGCTQLSRTWALSQTGQIQISGPTGSLASLCLGFLSCKGRWWCSRGGQSEPLGEGECCSCWPHPVVYSQVRRRIPHMLYIVNADSAGIPQYLPYSLHLYLPTSSLPPFWKARRNRIMLMYSLN